MKKLCLKLKDIKCFKIKLEDLHRYNDLLHYLKEYHPIVDNGLGLITIPIAENSEIKQYDLDHILAMVLACCSTFDINIQL